MKLNSTTQPAQDIAKVLSKIIISNIKQSQKVLLFLSGGSASQVYQILDQYFDPELDYHNLAIAMGDERWNQNPLHDKANWALIASAPIWSILKKQGAEIFSILTGATQENEALRFADFIERKLASAYKIISLQGIGKDGHTAGIIPHKVKLVFEQTYLDGHFTAAHKFGTDYAERITITPELFPHISEVLLFAVGADKSDVLKRFALLMQDDKMAARKDFYHLFPALYLDQTKLTVFTDQKLA
ncbi:MAG: 6-phosphogluconolactonase [bacterium]